MNFQGIFRLCNQIAKQRLNIRGYAYKTVKRPDPKTLKVPDLTNAPSLMEIIKEKIRLNGPITVAEYMHVVVTNPTEGYYLKEEVIGEKGDFITSPEISQLFGEMIAIWFSAETKKMCSGKPLQIVELGPGKGTLIVDLLRVLHRFGYQSEDMSIHLVEISETMQHIQAARLCIRHGPCDIESPFNYQGETISGIKIYWYNDLKKVPKEFSWFIAHEFFDVLPIHRFEKTEEGWREILIDIDESGKLRYRISSKETPAINLLVRPPLDKDERKSLEVSPRGLGIARQLANRVDSFGGLALIADYGHNGEKGDTFRAFQKHQLADPLETPGSSDLTADVDFHQLRLAASKSPDSENYALVAGPVCQREFLQRVGAPVRLQKLLEFAKTEEDKAKIQAAYDMLVDPNKMGDRFKFMAFYPSTMAAILEKNPPFGFST